MRVIRNATVHRLTVEKLENSVAHRGCHWVEGYETTLGYALTWMGAEYAIA